MTNPQTVPVPVNLLKRIVERTTTSAASDFGVPQELVSQALGRDILALAALIPNPPKVGDTVEYERRLDLPFGTVIADKDGDLWMRLEAGYAYISIDGRTRIEEESESETAPASYYGPFTVVYLRD